jgi:hypothetical protein
MFVKAKKKKKKTKTEGKTRGDQVGYETAIKMNFNKIEKEKFEK